MANYVFIEKSMLPVLLKNAFDNLLGEVDAVT
jgi:hypothetical protein